MKFTSCPAGIYQANCYIVYDDSTGNGFIIDPGGDHEKIIKIIEKCSVTAGFIILTHGHFDHTGGVNTLKSILNIPVYINEKDDYLISGDSEKHKFLPLSDKINIDRYIDDKDKIKYGNEVLEVIWTPGHTPGSISISTGGVLFTGDTLFESSIGRTDLPGGSFEQIQSSITQRLFTFPDETFVYPGHGPSTTIEFEKRNNPYV